ncbi:MAG TPA: methyltransferase domain-containing protein [Polyangiaceae bacterium LLY-WYZ-15_(1-7)]|nr:methyltransferase domain-containing protein [Polyangiaceae bacterium LLY-WYZ-15_(1-7)]HJL02798.1 methyltransferase domain-containing protein [Polyangiaceae bacterium LLY-WYZ-15_(1-7)]HJL10390.1 methyltransferase domain-containing protein [Polyangiaceae bacterium LLY-WYZ-15_(1-7)]HJL23573.1 methyltransferase domain-containing protein [Polyangiaceae bacterium LLY-WYZ-15_(1-7)]HJL30062.1 methyltransferase domain-containing protein [Polyangiaceae bacterium LLY-WYZ-15_(1-7)]
MTAMTTDPSFWDSVAEKYAARPVGDVPAFERKKAITLGHLRRDSKVLEIGCGTGSLALEMAPAAGHIHALDVSAEMLRIAEAKRVAAGVENVTFERATLEGASELAPASFDAAWAYSVLHLVDDRRAALARLFALLKPGGVLISSNVCLGESWVPYGALITVMRWFGKAPVVHSYDRQTVFADMRRAGFVEVEEKDVGAAKLVAFLVAKKPA